MTGEVYGQWRVAAVLNSGPWPWAWLVKIDAPMIQARISVHSLHILKEPSG